MPAFPSRPHSPARRGRALGAAMLVAMLAVARHPLRAADAAGGADATAAAGTVFEAAFTTTKLYAEPFSDVEVDVVFSSGTATWRVPAFYAGDATWKVRFAAPAAGRYRYRVESSDRGNAELNGDERSLLVVPYAGDNRLLAHGRLRIAADGRHFAHADGTPFLWLGDTWWKCLSRRMSLDDFRELAADRRDKGFTVVQIVCGPYPDEVMMAPGWENEGGVPYPRQDFSAVNPRFFDHADRRIAAVVEAGIVPAIVGGWGRPQQGGRSTLQQVGLAGFKRHWRHLVARYGAHPVVWIVGGEAKDAYGPWAELAAYVASIDPYDHPLCYHAPGDPRREIANNAAFDFDMVAIGHDGFATAAKTLEIARRCLAAEPRRPVVCGEACYERHMQTNFDDVQRHLFWSLLLGGAAGHTYGAAGIWQASVDGDPGIDPVYDRTTWREGMAFPGAIQLGHGRRLLERYPWERFEPHPEWAEPDCFAAGIPGEVRFIYKPRRRIYDWNGPTVQGLEADVTYAAFYFDPVRGTRSDLGPVAAATGEYRPPRTPSPQDWVLVIERRAP